MTHTKCRLVIRNALLVPMDPDQKQSFVANVAISDDGFICSIGTDDVFDADTIIDASGKWLLPGFISTHSHLWQSVFPGRVSDKTVSEWSEDIYSYASTLGAEDFYNMAQHGATSHLRKGITTAFNFTYSPKFRDGRADRAQFMGALSSGIRFIHGFNLGAIKANWSVDQALARTRKFLSWASIYQKTNQYLGTMIANHGITYKDKESNYAEAEIMETLDLQGHLHYLESSLPSDIDFERSRWRWLKDAGILGPRLILGHFVHPTPTMLSEAGVAGVRMSWNPLSNGRLGSGVADIPEYLKHNLSIGLGVDGEASSDRCDPFENMRMGLYSIRGMYKDPQVLKPFDVLHMHTLGAAQTLGIADRVGSITVGKYADMILLEPPRALRGGDPISILVLSAGIEHIKEVFVGGVPILSKPFASKIKIEEDWPKWVF